MQDSRGKSSSGSKQLIPRIPTFPNVVTSSKSSLYGNSDDGLLTPSDSPRRHNGGTHFDSINVVGDTRDDVNNIVDREDMELFSKSRHQTEEITLLRKQIADACLKELQLLNDKYTSERDFSDLRMALDEKQKEAITSASKELAHRKGDLDENIKLIHELKTVEEDRYIFTSSMLRLLAEHDIRPHVINASSISSSIKHLYDQLQWKIRTSHASIVDINSKLAIQTGDGNFNRENRLSDVSNNQPLEKSGVSNIFSPDNLYVHEHHLDSASNMLRSHLDHDPGNIKNPEPELEMQQHRFIDGNLRASRIDKRSEVSPEPEPQERHFGNPNGETSTGSHFLMMEDHGSYISEGEGLPGIEGFQIIGEAKPGNTLRACGYPVRGTALCMFQWVRHLQNGTRQYIEGATNTDYVVTADDVDKLIAVDCIPMDDKGCQGELKRLFANNQEKITCDLDMQMEIENYISAGRATFDVLLWVGRTDSSGDWEPRIIILKRYSYQIKNMDDVIYDEIYSADLSIKIPCGLTTQFVLTSSNGTSHPFSTTHDDVRMRDTLVLTMRIFQNKALDDRRKGKA